MCDVYWPAHYGKQNRGEVWLIPAKARPPHGSAGPWDVLDTRGKKSNGAPSLRSQISHVWLPQEHLPGEHAGVTLPIPAAESSPWRNGLCFNDAFRCQKHHHWRESPWGRPRDSVQGGGPLTDTALLSGATTHGHPQMDFNGLNHIKASIRGGSVTCQGRMSPEDVKMNETELPVSSGGSSLVSNGKWEEC